MTVESTTYISGLDTTLPTGSDVKSEGDNHLRLIKSTIKATFPNISGAVTPTHTELNFIDGVTQSLAALPAFSATGLVLSSGTTNSSFVFSKNQEGIVYCRGVMYNTPGYAGYVEYATLPTGYRPAASLYISIPQNIGGSPNSTFCYITTGGVISVYHYATNTANAYFNFCFPTT